MNKRKNEDKFNVLIFLKISWIDIFLFEKLCVILQPDLEILIANKSITMYRICQITGKRAMSGNNVSHSNAKTKRIFDVNLLEKKFYLAEEDRWITLRVSANGLRTINKKGLSQALKDAKAKGYIQNY